MKNILLLVALSAGLTACAVETPTSAEDSALSAQTCARRGKGAKVTLCHATGSATNPFVEITVSAAAYCDGHAAGDDDGAGDDDDAGDDDGAGDDGGSSDGGYPVTCPPLYVLVGGVCRPMMT
jgi:hypothetical protein